VSLRGRWWLPWLLGVIGTVAAIAAIVLAVDVPKAIAAIPRFDAVWLVPALAALTLQMLLRATRWSKLLSVATGRPIRLRRILEPLLVGYLGNNVLPARAGEAVRTVLVARREGIGVGEVAATVITERVLDLITLVGVAAVAVWLATGGVGGVGVGLIVVGVVGVAVARIVSTQALRRGWLDRLPDNKLFGLVRGLITAMGRLPLSVLLMSAGFSLLAWGCDAVIVLSVGRAVGADLPVAAAIAIGAGAVIGTAAPAAPGYVGTFELAAIAGGAAVGVPAETVLPIALVYHLMGLVPISIAGAIAMARLGGRSGIARQTSSPEDDPRIGVPAR
jgi:glycosyltransferase 2 family protein